MRVVKGLRQMDYLMIEFIVALLMLGITVVLLIKVVSSEIEQDIIEYRRRNHWRRWKKRRKK